MAELLEPAAVRSALAARPGWTGDGSAIPRPAELPSFPAAIAGVNQVADVAEELNHHPDIDIRWRTVTFRCATHSAGGVTSRDLDLAARIAEVLAAAGVGQGGDG